MKSRYATALAVPPDSMGQLEAEFLPLASFLPPRGEVGYLEPFEDVASDCPESRRPRPRTIPAPISSTATTSTPVMPARTVATRSFSTPGN